MDAIHYDKIADKLVNFNSKLPQSVDLESSHAIYLIEKMKRKIEDLLYEIDHLADADNNGWIR